MTIAAHQGVCPTCLHDHSAPLASSGDHAELARVAAYVAHAREINQGAILVSTGDLEALIAEVEALRESIGRHDQQVAGMLRARLAAENRAAEAECKLAEAVADKDPAFERLDTEINQHGDALDRLAFASQLLRDYVEFTHDGHDVSALNSETRTFLSKEAERG